MTTPDTPLPARLRAWQGTRSARQAALALGVPLATYRHWVYGTRRPHGAALTLIEQTIAASHGALRFQRDETGRLKLVTPYGNDTNHEPKDNT